MKGTPETPQCGFSRASIQVLGMQGVDPSKFAAFNVLEDPELRQGMSSNILDRTPVLGLTESKHRNQGVQRLAYYPAAIHR